MVLRVTEDVVSTVLDGEAVLLNLSSGQYCSLNPTASVIWDQLNDGYGIEEAVRELTGRFEIDAPTARRDVVDLVGQMVAAGILANS